MTEMMRFNKGKIDLTQTSWLVRHLLSMVFMFGELKYKRNNWKNGKATMEETMLNLSQSVERHWQGIQKGEFFDPESKLPHAIHMIWNLGRMVDFYYFGLNHMKDGKDLYHQPLQHELPEVPQKIVAVPKEDLKPGKMVEIDSEQAINLFREGKEIGVEDLGANDKVNVLLFDDLRPGYRLRCLQTCNTCDSNLKAVAETIYKVVDFGSFSFGLEGCFYHKKNGYQNSIEYFEGYNLNNFERINVDVKD